MVDWSLFVYGLPAAAGVLVFLKVIADRLEWVEAMVALRAEQLAAAEAARREEALAAESAAAA